MTALTSLIPGLQRELAGPGDFDTVFPNSDDADLLGRLEDGFAKAQLDGWFGTVTLDLATHEATPDISIAGSAIVVLYASMQAIRAQLRALKTRKSYEAAGSKYEIEQSANVLTMELKRLESDRDRLLALTVRQARATSSVYTSDAYLIRAYGYFPGAYFGEIGGFFGWELPVFPLML